MVIVFDLDDTLYDEVDFVKSGLREVAEFLGEERYFDFMWELFRKQGSGKIFNRLLERFDIPVPLQKLVEIYRFHPPRIALPEASVRLLEFSESFPTALVSDGHYIMQQNKFRALGLDRFVDYPVFTDLYHTRKPETKGFQMVMNRFAGHRDFVYISDNPRKDFVAPRQLGWKTIRFRNPNGIYRHLGNDALYEVEKRDDIIPILEELKSKSIQKSGR